MKKTLFILAIITMVSACNQTRENKSTENTQKQDITTVTVADVLATPEKFTDQEVEISGMVTHVCRHGGQKLFIINENPDAQLRVNVGGNLPEFDVALEGSNVQFTGFVRMLSEPEAESMQEGYEEKDHHSGDEAHAEAEQASYYIEAHEIKEN